jgi:endonuclease/exonuclease/phosphatase family metal-dependent hydrolase
MRWPWLWLIAFSLTGVVSFRSNPATKPAKRYRVLFCNAENFFDTHNDSLTADEEFTPQGRLHWTYQRYLDKQNMVYKTIVAAGEWQPPDIIGMCEVENRGVLSDLLAHTPLAKYPYRIVHANSPDRRGIDVAMLYNSTSVRVISNKYIRIRKKGLRTRDILYCRMLLADDTLHVLVNHWPSRSAGRLETESDRQAAATTLRRVTDSLFAMNKMARILIMGDFNDEPQDNSLTLQLFCITDLRSPKPGSLYNLSTPPLTGDYRGTVKYRGQWSIFDQIIVSGELLKRKGVHVLPDGYRIFGAPFLLYPDHQYNGMKPNRTYNGIKYAGGFSDHLPVYIDLYAD